MKIFIAGLNIEHFREMIARECDAEKLDMLRRLLAEEQAKLAILMAEGASSSPPKAANASDEYAEFSSSPL